MHELLPQINQLREQVTNLERALEASSVDSIGEPLGSCRMFGAQLSDLVSREGVVVPEIVRASIAFLSSEDYLTQVGIFRLSGSACDVESLQISMDHSGNVDLSCVKDPHVVTCLLKSFCRSLREPLIPFDLFEDALEAVTYESAQICCAFLHKLINHDMPKPNLYSLTVLLAHMARIAKRHEVNKMTISNLAAVLAPNLLYPKDQTDHMKVIRKCLSNSHFNFIEVRA